MIPCEWSITGPAPIYIIPLLAKFISLFTIDLMNKIFEHGILLFLHLPLPMAYNLVLIYFLS
ncbi:hypothetical protein B7P43_G03701 [Cryptotermes secundus]|uniref:Uncharacterized protein n=1 Tax=Cryptotermes secundus TaxID=105785 RepID=A0A2J7RHM0_9NEOP|nr:hypothetical protein B7P43_G03701 [Cryptotermes secundus]